MMERRRVIGTTMAAGLGGLLAPQAQQRTSGNDRDDEKIATAIDELRSSIERQFEATELGPSVYVSRIRQIQRAHLAATQRYPAFLEVGVDVWEHVYDWHVKHQQPLDARMLADGRYAMKFMFTTLLLRPDQPPEFVGVPFDVAPRP